MQPYRLYNIITKKNCQDITRNQIKATERMFEHLFKNLLSNTDTESMTNKQLNAFLEALAIIAEQDTENTVKYIRRIQSKLEKKKSVDNAASTTVEVKILQPQLTAAHLSSRRLNIKTN